MLKVAIVDGGYNSYEIEERTLGEADAEPVHMPLSDVLDKLTDCSGLLVRQSEITREVFQVLPSLRVIGRYGIGVDNVDLETATERGVVVANTPHYADEEVSTQAVALFLAAVRFVVAHHEAVKRGEWDVASRYPTRRLRDRTMGLLGLGAIAGTAVPKFKGLGLNVIAYDPYLPGEAFAEANVERVDLDALLTQSDYISVHAPATPETRHILDAAAFNRMKDGVVIVNTSRGPLIDENALAEAVRSGKVAAAGLDVYETEPLPMESPLRELDRVVLTDHASWYSEDSIFEMQTMAAEAVRDVLLGKTPRNVVNRDVLPKLNLPDD